LIFTRQRTLAGESASGGFDAPLQQAPYPKMLNGARKNLSNLVLNFVTYLRDAILEAVSKPQIRLKSKAQ
jgi:hypothetical protein